MTESTGTITILLREVRKGSGDSHRKLFSMVYDELVNIANAEIRRGFPQRTVTKTGLVHEVYLRLSGPEQLDCENRAHFFALAARAMRFILIDYARRKKAEKREGARRKVTLLDGLVGADQKAQELIELDAALDKLARLNERLAKVVELRYFGKMSIEDIAEVMNVSKRTVDRDWLKARGWLYRELKEAVL